MAQDSNENPKRKGAREAAGAAPSRRAFDVRMDRLRLRHLRLLDLIARLGSLSAAADELGVSQPGATKMLQEVEAAFGCVLVARTAKGGKLTAAGLNTLDRLRVALQALGSARSALEALPEMPLVRLGILPLVGIQALGQVVGAMHAEGSLPRVQVRMDNVEGLLTSLSEGQVDCAVGVLESAARFRPSRRFHVVPLWPESLVIVAASAHPLVRRRQVTLEQVRDQDWVLQPAGSSNRRALEELFQGAGLEPPAARIEAESFHIALALVAASRLLTTVPESAYRRYPTCVQAVPTPRAFTPRSMAFITLADAPPLPAVAKLSQWFQHHAQTAHLTAPAPRRAAQGTRTGRAR